MTKQYTYNWVLWHNSAYIRQYFVLTIAKDKNKQDTRKLVIWHIVTGSMRHIIDSYSIADDLSFPITKPLLL